MTEPTNTKAAGIVHAIAAYLDKDVIGWINLIIFLSVPALAFMGLVAVYRTYVHPAPVEKTCWDVKVVKDRILKINQCTGDVSEVNLGPLSEVAKTLDPSK